MRRVALPIFLTVILLVTVSCEKDKESERFKLLTGRIWQSNELLVDGADESAGLLAGFVGEAKFNKDGTGYFGQFAYSCDFGH